MTQHGKSEVVETSDAQQRIKTVISAIGNEERPSIASITNVMTVEAWLLWRKLWLASLDISQGDFESLPSKIVGRAAVGTYKIVTCKTAAEWSKLTSLNPLKKRNNMRRHVEINFTGGLNHWSVDFITKWARSTSTSFYIDTRRFKINRETISKMRYVLRRMHQHVIIIV